MSRSLDEDVLINDEGWVVANVAGSSGHKRNWKAYWLRDSGRGWPAVCQIKGCGGSAAVGGHMYIKGMRSHYNFILPICSSCNNDRRLDWDGPRTEWAPAKTNALFVPVKASDVTFE
jgi:hypothetical protein